MIQMCSVKAALEADISAAEKMPDGREKDAVRAQVQKAVLEANKIEAATMELENKKAAAEKMPDGPEKEEARAQVQKTALEAKKAEAVLQEQLRVSKEQQTALKVKKAMAAKIALNAEKQAVEKMPDGPEKDAAKAKVQKTVLEAKKAEVALQEQLRASVPIQQRRPSMAEKERAATRIQGLLFPSLNLTLTLSLLFKVCFVVARSELSSQKHPMSRTCARRWRT